MSLGTPLGLLALLAIAPLVAAYFLRRKQQPRVVSALFLWKSPDTRAEAGPRLQRFSRELSLLLEVLAVAAAALYLADVRFGADRPRRHLAVVVDGGLSMSARVGGKPVADRVRDALAALVQQEAAATVTLVESGASPRLLAGPHQEVARALSELEAWRPAQPTHAYEPAWRLARELAGPAAKVHFFTDGALEAAEPAPAWLSVKSLGEAVDNAALVSVQRKDAGGVAQVTLRVANFGQRRVTLPVRLRGEGVDREEKLTLEAGATAALRVGMTAQGPLEVALPDDALPEDGRVTLLPAPEPELTVGFLPGLEPAAESALRRFVRAVPGARVGESPLLSFGSEQVGARVRVGTRGELRSFVGPFFAQKGSALLEDVFLDGVVWTAGEQSPPGRALLAAGAVVLLSEEEDGVLHLNLELSRSNLVRASAWPVLLSNILRGARREVPGLPRRHLALGEATPVVLKPGAKHVLLGPGGLKKPVLGQGAVSLPPLPAPGKWVLERDGEAVDALVVLPLDARESDLRTRGPFSTEAPLAPALASLGLERPRAWWPIALLLALLLVDFWLTARSRAA